MTETEEAVARVEEFERHPALASWIERMGNSAMGLSLGEWMIFLGALNRAFAAEREARERAERNFATATDCVSDITATLIDTQDALAALKAEVVEAAEYYSCDCDPGYCETESNEDCISLCGKTARDLLAKLKGEG